MMCKMRHLTTIILFTTALNASGKEYVELQSRYTKLYEFYVVHDDFTVERITELEIKALTESAAKKLKTRKFSHSTSIEEMEILEAYTVKSDGTKIEVPEDNYQVTVNRGNGSGGAIFSDRTSITVVFPDLEKDDSTYVKLKNLQTEPMFAKNFSESRYFWSQTAYDDVRINFDLPGGLAFKHQVRGMKEKIKNKNGRKLIRLTYRNAKPVKIKRSDFSVWDESREAGYALSTFMDYQSVAKAYGDRASPKAIPTDRVKKLAKKIVAKEKDRKIQARLLYNWVASNITYAGNCIGVGAVVPHDTDFILNNKMGDCKDHATLLEALFTSTGIKSTQALINSGSSYSLPEIPMVTSVNHVINYIPEWDKFVDSTNSSMPFDRLSFALGDKPVLLVDNFKSGQKTPPSQFGDNHQEVDSTMKILADGSVEGDIHLKLLGQPAIGARHSWRDVTQEQEDRWLESVFSSNNQIGHATMMKDDPEPLQSDFSYSFEFKRPEFILSKGAGGFYIGPLANASLGIYALLNYSKEEIEDYDTTCTSGYSIERLVYEFPKGMKILAKPDNFEIEENHIKFLASYELEGRKLKVVRELSDSTPGNVCSAETVNRQRQTLIKISEHLKTQVVYQH